MLDDLKEKLKKPPSLETVLQMFYDMEQNVSISCFWHAGWDFKIGDNANGYKDTGNFDTLEEGTAWLYAWYRARYGEGEGEK